MLIIFEGISCSGKSTLSREVSKSLAIPLFSENLGLVYKLHKDYNLFDLINFGINKTILELVKKFNLDLILDRGFVSDLVSVSWFRSKGIYFQRSVYNELLKDLDYKIFHLSVSREDVISRRKKRVPKIDYSEDYIDMQMQLQTYYKELIKKYNYNAEFLVSSNLPSSLRNLIAQVKEKI